MPDPLWLNTITYDAHELRVADALMTMSNGTGRGGRQGVRPGTGLGTTISGTTITVASGSAFVSAPNGEGSYRVALDSSWTQVINAADATFTRIDLVYLRVWDTDLDGTGLRQVSPVYLAGTPSGSPVAPSIPAGLYAFPLATVTVPASGGGAATVSTAVMPLTVAPGGILPVPSADLGVAGLHTGQTRYNLARSVLETWTGTAWLAAGDTQPYTPVWTAATTNPNKGSGSVNGEYSLVGDTCTFAFEIMIASDTNPGSGAYSISVPFPIGGISRTGTGQAIGGSGPVRIPLSIPLASGNTAVQLFAPSGSGGTSLATLGSAGVYGTNAWVAGNVIRGNGTYKIA
ncbi:hypothetical protein [Streptomyces sp.]|uniref:hypothetical protein n=1 Tax=Streptomyces sp. TaxID=1931 RepID=UPI002F3FA8E2